MISMSTILKFSALKTQICHIYFVCQLTRCKEFEENTVFSQLLSKDQNNNVIKTNKRNFFLLNLNIYKF